MNNMMSFMRSNVAPVENAHFAASPRFVGEDGNPINWEICCISSEEYSKLRGSCVRQVPVVGKKNQFTQQLDSEAFQAKVAARCTVFPNLNDAALQDDWGVKSPEALLCAMLVPGEFEDYAAAVFQHNGFKNDNELVQDAKN